MSDRRHVTARDSSNYGPNSNLAHVEEFLVESPTESQEISSVAPLRSQLALEFRLQSLCQRLLESYKDQHDWAAVGQVAQSLVTNSQRVSFLKDRLLSGNYSYFTSPRRLQSISEQPSCDSLSHSLLISQVDNEATQETGTESGSESSSVGKTKEAAPSLAKAAVSASSESASSAVDYETASQRTTCSETEPETSTTSLELSTDNSSIVQLLSVSTTPSPAHSSSSESSGGEIGCGTENLDTPEQQQPVLTSTPPSTTDTLQISDISTQHCESDSPAVVQSTEEEKDSQKQDRDSSSRGEKESVKEALEQEEVGNMAEVADTNYVEMHLGGGEGEGKREVENGVWNGVQACNENTAHVHSDGGNTGSGSDDGTEYSSKYCCVLCNVNMVVLCCVCKYEPSTVYCCIITF